MSLHKAITVRSIARTSLVAASLAAAALLVPMASALPALEETLTITQPASGSSEPDWAPEGNRLAFVRGATLVVVEPMLDDVRSERVLATGAISGPDWSPDGKQIVFARSSSPSVLDDDLWVVNADGSGERRLTSFAGVNGNFALNPAWSPDGSRIAFEGVTNSDPNADVHVHTIAPDGGGLSTLITPSASGLSLGGPAWSPDATRVAYVEYPTVCSGLGCADVVRVRRLDGSSDVIVASGTFIHDVPTWSPDGSELVLQRIALDVLNARFALASVRADGSGLATLNVGGGSWGRAMPDWSAARNALAYVSLDPASPTGSILVGAPRRPQAANTQVEAEASTASLLALIDPDALPAAIWFEWGETTAYGRVTEALLPTSFPSRVSATLTGLAPLTTYHARLVISNGRGTRRGPDATFTTRFAGSVRIADGKQYVAGLDVQLSIVAPPQATRVEVLNAPLSGFLDFTKATSLPIAATIGWRLPDLRTKTGTPATLFNARVAVRVLGPWTGVDLVHDDTVTVDRAAPLLRKAWSETIGRARANRPQRYRIRVNAHDRGAFTGKLEVSERKGQAGRLLGLRGDARRGGFVLYRTRADVVWVRIADAAGNRSQWVRLVLSPAPPQQP